jgi:hypothetical protein
MARDLSREQLHHALVAWAYFIGGGGESLKESLAAALPWVEARWDAGDDYLPLTLIHDLGHLLLRGREFRFASAKNLARWTEDERAQRLAYEDRVIGRWAVDPSVTEAHIAIAGMNVHVRATAVAHAIGLALGPPLRAQEDLARSNPAHLRGYHEQLISLVPDQFDQWLDNTPDDKWRAWAKEQLELSVAALPSARLFKPEDLWEIANLERLPSDSARMALREVNTNAARVGMLSPTIANGIKRKAREVPVDAEEADQYPAGGFDAISTKGTFENLVRSEVAYVGEGRAEAGIDLFDIRFAEGELLYYTRDESPLLDARRDVVFVFDRPAEQRFKIPTLPSQTLVLSQAMAFAVQGDLVKVFGPAGSKAKFVWIAASDADREAANEELQLLAFLLSAELAHRRAELLVVDSWDQVSESGRVVFSPHAERQDLARMSWVRVGQEQWQIGEALFDLRDEPAPRAIADHLLLAIAKGEARVNVKKRKKSTGPARSKPSR